MKDLSGYSNWQMYHLGTYFRSQGVDYLTMALDDEFDSFIARHKINTKQLGYFREGMLGKPWVPETKPDDVIMPFGKHQGKSITTLEMAELVRLSEQVWINRWPTVAAYLKRSDVAANIAQYNKDYEVGMKALKHLNV